MGLVKLDFSNFFGQYSFFTSSKMWPDAVVIIHIADSIATL